MRNILLVWLLLCLVPPPASARPNVWGLRGGVRFGIYPGSLSGRGTGGPRGVLRIWYPARRDGKYTAINFIAIEPVVHGRKSYSELDMSGLDHRPGKRMTIIGKPRRRRLADGTDVLRVNLRLERFSNGAHVRLAVTQRSDRPDQLTFAVAAEPDSAPLDECPLSATWGNHTRSRRLWLRDRVVSCRRLLGRCRRGGFTRDAVLGSRWLRRLADGSLVAAITTDEADPAAVYPVSGTRHFYYAGEPVTQYWLRPAGGRGVRLRVNGRRCYWKSRQRIPGGLCFENFELRERWRPGQRFVFGVTRRSPRELGW